MEKKIIGIDINEILRARWLQFDRFYVEEFGEDKAPNEGEGIYTYDFWKDYHWEDSVVEDRYLKEDAPETISPTEYEIDPETGIAPVDFLLFSKEVKTYTAREAYKKFLYEDYLFEIFASAPVMYPTVGKDIEKFYKKYRDQFDIRIVSKENWFTIPPTLNFLSKTMPRFKHYHFVESNEEMWDTVDILITTDPELLSQPENKKIIKLSRPYNDTIKVDGIEVMNVSDLYENKNFEDFVGYIKPQENNTEKTN